MRVYFRIFGPFRHLERTNRKCMGDIIRSQSWNCQVYKLLENVLKVTENVWFLLKSREISSTRQFGRVIARLHSTAALPTRQWRSVGRKRHTLHIYVYHLLETQHNNIQIWQKKVSFCIFFQHCYLVVSLRYWSIYFLNGLFP